MVGYLQNGGQGNNMSQRERAWGLGVIVSRSVYGTKACAGHCVPEELGLVGVGEVREVLLHLRLPRRWGALRWRGGFENPWGW